jgi:NAD+ diphosphatase
MPNTYWIIFSQNKLCIFQHQDQYHLPDSIEEFDLQEYTENAVLLHQDDKQVIQLLDLQHAALETVDNEHQHRLVTLREVLLGSINLDFQHIARAWQYAQFLRTHQYCGQCGASTRQVQWEMARQWDFCQHRTYPRVSPCIIVAIHNGKQILLAQGNRHTQTQMYSTLAGFVESGESLEQAVHREVAEEVGVKLKNIQYFGSQPWPFPHSLMMGFTAEYAGGDIVVDGKEILHADWFDPEALPHIPPSISIARDLIDYTCEQLIQKS